MKAFPGAKMTLKSQEAIPLGSGYIIDHASVGLPPPGEEGATGASPAPQ